MTRSGLGKVGRQEGTSLPRRHLALLSAAAVAAAILVAGTLLAALAPPPGRNVQLASRIEDWVHRPDGSGRLELADLTDFEWSSVAVFSPYVTNAQARDVLGFDWPVERTPVANSESGSLLVFVHADRVVAWADPRVFVRPFTGKPSFVLPRAGAVFADVGNELQVIAIDS